jgi:hypothetical protein
MPKHITHSLLLLFASAGTYLWLITPSLTPYTLQLVAVLLLIYAATHWFRKPKRSQASTPTSHIPLDLTLLTIIILLLVVETGALASPLIFLLYFLVFAVAMLFEIEATLMLTGTLLAFFLLLPSTNLTDLAHLGELLAFVMITPLSLYISHQHEDIARQKARTHTLTNHLAQEETDTLLFLSTNLKTTLLSALDSLSIIIPKTTAKKAKSDLSVLYSDLRALYRSAQDLQNSIDLETD